MYFWSKYPFVRFVCAFIAGIVAFDRFPIISMHSLAIIGTLLVIFLVTVLYARKKGIFYRLRHLTGLLALAALFFIGGSFTDLKYHRKSQNHYSNLTIEPLAFSGTIDSYPNERKNYIRYHFTINEYFFSRDSIISGQGKILLYVRKDSVHSSFQYGDKLLVRKTFFPISAPKNPEAFDYQLYMARQGIFSHAFVDHSDIRKLSDSNSSWIIEKAFALRATAAKILKKHFPQPEELGIAEALLLGIKDHLDEELQQSYSKAGAMHVLAVSGLHVGIIYLMIRILFGKLKNLGKAGRILFAGTSIITIWYYALVTGMSPSVLRAATMFSLIAITQASTRESNIYNTLAFTAFLLLIFDPYLIYSVGFQLSFIAVLGIVYLQPRISRLLSVNNRLLEKVWAISCVSLAAQIATLPLTLYYFHQLPTYFLISNLVVIPAAFFLLVGGILLVTIDTLVPEIARVLGMILDSALQLMNRLIGEIELLPFPVIDWISIDLQTTILIYLFILTLATAVHFGNFRTLTVSSLIVLCIFTRLLMRHEWQAKRDELIIYHLEDHLAMDHISGYKASLLVDPEVKTDTALLSYQIDPHRRASFLPTALESLTVLTDWGVSQDNSIRTGTIGTWKLFIFDSTTFHLNFTEPIDADIVVIRNEAVKSLDWLHQHFPKTQYFVLSSGNSGFYIRKMRQSAAELDLNIHSTKVDGSLIIDSEGIKKERTMLPALFTTNPD